MSKDLSSLNEEHVRQLGRIIETLEKSTFDFLQIEVGELKVTVGKGNVALPETASPAQPVAAVSPPATPRASSTVAQAAPSAQPPTSGSAHQGTVDIKSPIMGIFYAQPEPGAPPFVTAGSLVAEDTTVALVEVMKTFNAVSAGAQGRVVEVCAQDGQLVEFGQVLFRVIPE